MSKKERDFKILWLSVPGIGRVTFTGIKIFAQSHNLSLQELWEDSGKHAEGLKLSKRKQIELEKFKKNYSVNSYLDSLAEKNIQVVLENDENYPQLLSGLDDRPPILFCRGNISLLKHERPFGVVGTRRITSYGRQVTKLLTQALVERGFLITSGFMYGVDSVAHKVAMQFKGPSIGVLGFGFDNFSPLSQAQFAREFIEVGNLLITEYAPHLSAHPGSFPLRNRIVAGMSVGILVTEAAKKSGSHITAHRALDYGRFVGAVPGPITNEYCEGTKWLINQGAKLVSCVDDIAEDLEFFNEKCQMKNGKSSFNVKFTNLIEEKIYESLQVESMSADQLVKEIDLEIGEVNQALTMLELQGLIISQGGLWLLK